MPRTYIKSNVSKSLGLILYEKKRGGIWKNCVKINFKLILKTLKGVFGKMFTTLYANFEEMLRNLREFRKVFGKIEKTFTRIKNLVEFKNNYWLTATENCMEILGKL